MQYNGRTQISQKYRIHYLYIVNPMNNFSKNYHFYIQASDVLSSIYAESYLFHEKRQPSVDEVEGNKKTNHSNL